jgi:hypothetical protein
MMRLKKMMAGAALLCLAACASGGGGGGGGSGGAGRDLILLDEISASGVSDAYSLVSSRRPHWLRVRGDQNRGRTAGVGVTNAQTGEYKVSEGSTPPSPNVYLNNARMGMAESLRQIPITGVRYVQFFNAAQANLRWGAGNSYGAILISTEDLQP